MNTLKAMMEAELENLDLFKLGFQLGSWGSAFVLNNEWSGQPPPMGETASATDDRRHAEEAPTIGDTPRTTYNR